MEEEEEENTVLGGRMLATPKSSVYKLLNSIIASMLKCIELYSCQISMCYFWDSENHSLWLSWAIFIRQHKTFEAEGAHQNKLII